MVEVVGLPVAEEHVGEFGGGEVPDGRAREGREVVGFEPGGVGVSEGIGGVGEERGDGGDGGGGDLGAVAEELAAGGVQLHCAQEPREEVWRGGGFPGEGDEVAPAGVEEGPEEGAEGEEGLFEGVDGDVAGVVGFGAVEEGEVALVVVVEGGLG